MQSRVEQFQADVKERFGFLSAYEYRITEFRRIGDRFALVRFEATDRPRIVISWDSHDGTLEAELGEENLWHMLANAGLWFAGRDYQGYAVTAMQHGLDRLASFLLEHPALIS